MNYKNLLSKIKIPAFLLGISLAVAGHYSNSQITRVNPKETSKLVEIIEKSKNIESYEKRIVNEPIGTLIHIRQKHELPLIRANKVKEDIKYEVINVQSNIVEFLKEYDLKKVGKKYAMLEELTEKSNLDLLKIRYALQDIEIALTELESPIRPMPPIRTFILEPTESELREYESANKIYYEELQTYNKEIKIFENKLIKAEINKAYSGGSSKFLLENNNFILLPSTTKELHERAISRLIEIVKNKEKSIEDPLIMNKRENMAISLVSQYMSSGKKEVIMVYGGAHDFKDNVGNWNKEHPSKRISLITITPKSYK